MGFRLAIYPGLGRYAAGFAIREALGTLARDGSTRSARSRMLTFREYNDALKLRITSYNVCYTKLLRFLTSGSSTYPGTSSVLAMRNGGSGL